jgi:rsbT co-antagonist protein RsbR
MARERLSRKKESVQHKLDICERILDNVAEEIMLLDLDYKILWANKKVHDTYGNGDAAVVSNFCYKVTHKTDHACRPPYDICPLEEALKSGKPTTVLHTHFDKEGNKVYAEVSGYPVYQDDKLVEFIHISRNVTERVMAEEHMREQQKAILELSTPVVEMWDGIITLPLIGVIDSSRAKQIMESLLEAIIKTQAGIAIIDITGVPLVDTEVADRLIRAIKAAGLLGTKCIMVGIKPDIAQSMVHLGVDLSGVATFSTLQAGIEAAFKEVNLEVIKK